MKHLESIFGVILAFTFMVVFLYITYWAFKTVSYEIFYEAMVLETIKETVSDAALK